MLLRSKIRSIQPRSMVTFAGDVTWKDVCVIPIIKALLNLLTIQESLALYALQTVKACNNACKVTYLKGINLSSYLYRYNGGAKKL